MLDPRNDFRATMLAALGHVPDSATRPRCRSLTACWCFHLSASARPRTLMTAQIFPSSARLSSLYESKEIA